MTPIRSAATALSFLTVLSFSSTAEAQIVRLGKGAGKSVLREETYKEEIASKVVKVSFQLKKARLETRARGPVKYTELAVSHVPLTSEPGQPALPFQAATVDAAASDIRVRAELGEPVTLDVGRLMPAQEELCRCPGLDKRARLFLDKVSEYKATDSGFRIESLGDFRGKPISRVLLFPHKYDPKSGKLLLYPNARFEISYPPRSNSNSTNSVYDYLVISPRNLMGGLASWVDWKRSSQGLRFNVVAYEDLGLADSEALKNWIHNEYNRAQFKYALIVGARSRIPQQVVQTTTDQNTPSDLPYYTMGGADDVVPEVYAGRVVADNADAVARILKKWIDYEKDTTSAAGWSRVVGVASNEGSGPSDADYILAIQDKFKSVFRSDSIYLFQNNADSTPANFNSQLGTGAAWVTYVGHGSGNSWPSFGQPYTVANIQNLKNSGSVKPVWIDVACLNGALESEKAGAQLASVADSAGNGAGVTAYYGGTVLVSWHPPAIFARGVAFKVSEMVRPVLGEAIQAGQRYLTENTSNLQDIASNQRWYHLQGDPSLRLRLK
ncbi:MAG TPA: C25 family cysteine peptidase [Bdellovibrionota bacterium]|jgi:hypothetical protein